MTTYKDALTASMTELGKHPEVVVCGYNVTKPGGAGGGTFAGIPEEQRIEMPLAENLMAGASIGLSLQGYVPILWFERMDFILCGLDAICNHLDKIKSLSEGIHKPAAIIRCVVGNSETPLYTGVTHTQNFTKALKEMVSFPVYELHHKGMIETFYASAYRNAKAGTSTCLVEMKDIYNT